MPYPEHHARQTRARIVESARKLFNRHGFDRVSIGAIMEEAGLTHGGFYRHFASKDDLYWEVLSVKGAPDEVRRRLDEKLQSDVEPIEIFTSIALHVLHRNVDDPAKCRLLLFSALENHRLSQRFFKTYMSEWYELLAGYIRRQIEEGRFRPVDPVLAARGFIGMVFHHYLVQELFGGNKYQSFDLDEVARTMAELWLNGICCQPEEDQLSPSSAKTSAAPLMRSLSAPKQV